MALIRGFNEPFEGWAPGMVGLEERGGLFTHMKTAKMIPERYAARRFLGIQLPLGRGELDNINWLPGTGNPAGSLTKVRIDMAPPPRILGPRRFNPGSLRAR